MGSVGAPERHISKDEAQMSSSDPPENEFDSAIENSPASSQVESFDWGCVRRCAANLTPGISA